MSELNKMVGFLEEYHSEDLKEIVDISAKKLTDKSNFIKITNKNTPRGMGYDIRNITEFSSLLHPTDYGIYKVYCGPVDLYTGEGWLMTRIGRCLKAINGENRHDESHAADELHRLIQEGKIDKEKLLNNLYFTKVNFINDLGNFFFKLLILKNTAIRNPNNKQAKPAALMVKINAAIIIRNIIFFNMKFNIISVLYKYQ